MKAPKLNGKYSVAASIKINASQADTWALLSDFNNVYTWAPGVKVSHGLSQKEKMVGAGRHCELPGFGAIDEVVTQWQEGTGFVYDVTPLGPLNNAYSSWWLTKLNDQTTRLDVVLSYDLRFGLFGKLLHSLIMKNKLQSSLPDTLSACKKRVETGELIRPLLTDSSKIHSPA